MQHSVLSFHLNISVWSAERESDKDRAAQSETKTEVQKGKGTKSERRERVSEKRADKENKGRIRRRGERWIERLIVREGATQCSIYIRLPKDT